MIKNQSRSEAWIKHEQLISDFCRGYFSDQARAQSTLRTLETQVGRLSRRIGFKKFERAWVLSIVYQALLNESIRHPNEGVLPDAQSEKPLTQDQRIERFSGYVKMLVPQQRFAVLALETFQVPLEEVASAMELPAESVRFLWRQALRSLEDWIWVKK